MDFNGSMTKATPRYAIVVAGGSGLRMGTDKPKQFLPLGGLPILMHTLRRFAPLVDRLVLVLPEEHISYWQELCREYGFHEAHEICHGGKTRYHSVKNALHLLGGGEGVVAVHDGVRPFVSDVLINRCFTRAEELGAAMPAIPLVDSLRYVYEGGSRAEDRSRYLAVQTPQVFDLERLSRAYALGYREEFTDDASVYEGAGMGRVELLQGEDTNIKITRPQDLATAEFILRELILPR